MIPFIFYGNYFYGLCAVALCIEASLQQRIPPGNAAVLLGIFAATVWYYTRAYVHEGAAPALANARSWWYVEHRRLVTWSQRVLGGIFWGCAVLSWIQLPPGALQLLVWPYWVLLGLFPVCGALYYGLSSRGAEQYNLRHIGWLKPFLIGFCWAGMVQVFPTTWYFLSRGEAPLVSLVSGLLFFKNFMFVSVLAIMFDIKDYASDYNHHIKTFVVRWGLRRTIFFILFPLTVLGLCSFVGFALARHFSTMKILINLLPFLLMMYVAYGLQRRRSILYYLIAIDGVMLVKGICGSIAMWYF
jgi:hypothetical protein